jgi:glycosyltransferase involved in cell wall biosynthesis
MKSTLIISNKNEQLTLRDVIRKSRPFVDEILVIDGHSTDDSQRIAEAEHVRFLTDNGKGKGAGIRLGIRKAKGDVLVFIDADGSHNPLDIPQFIKPIHDGKTDLVLGSRTKGGSDELNGSIEKSLRVIGSSVITQAINSRFHTVITDSQNGFRAIRGSVARKLHLAENIFTIEQEMIMKALKLKYRVIEVPSHESVRIHGRSHIRLLHVCWRFAWCLAKNIL